VKVNIIDYLKPLIITGLSFFIPIIPLLILVGIFIFSDTIIGIWAAIRRGEKITSRKLGNIIPKMLLYQSSVLVGYMMDVWLLQEFTKNIFSIDLLVTKLITMTLIFTEFLSLNENIEYITGKNLFLKFKEMITRVSRIKGDVKDLVD
jgi:hypothetical protein